MHDYTTCECMFKAYETRKKVIVLLSSPCSPPPHLPTIRTAGNRIHPIRSAAFLSPNCPIPTPPPLHSPVPLTVVIGSAGIIQRQDIIYCLPCTIPLPLSPPSLNRTRCPADELIILEILFLLLIPPFYEQLLFMVQWI